MPVLDAIQLQEHPHEILHYIRIVGRFNGHVFSQHRREIGRGFRRQAASSINGAQRLATPGGLREVESIEIHYSVPGRNKIVNEFFLAIGTGVDFGQRAELRV
jgi:hypothetical protein